MRTFLQRFAPPLLLIALASCGEASEGGGEAQGDTAAATEQASVVDSVFPMPVMLERFRAGLAEPEGLTSGVDSRDALVEGIIRAMEATDTAAFERLTITLPEWAWLYFPTSIQAKPPYELPPGLAWFQLQEGNRKGLFRALGRFGGRKLQYRGYTCASEPTVEGVNRVWIGCLVTVGLEGEGPAPIKLFSSILERDGRFAILSFVNDF
jgi:hypothetical protein